ncbi:hypothetical protein BLOT_002853 [Blomia tropicalis]|nr:hypothetical protein BLOT_002853 [Blomia tropicalis]
MDKHLYGQTSLWTNISMDKHLYGQTSLWANNSVNSVIISWEQSVLTKWKNDDSRENMQEDQLLWIEQLPTEVEETIQKCYERLSIWSAKAAVLETQRKMTLDRLRIDEAAKHGRTQRTDLSKIELAKHDEKLVTFYAFWQQIKAQLVDRTDVDDHEKHIRPCSAVSVRDADVMTSGSLEEAMSYLTEKYVSTNAVRRVILEKM